MATEDQQPRLFESASGWRAWLKQHHASSSGIWLQIAKKDAALVSLTIQEALDGALCYGWIDGQRKSLDAESYLQRYTPRTKRSPWSKINRDKVAALIASKKMRAPGLREIERAKEDGRWDAAYASQKNMAVPEDLQAALAKKPRARTFFEQLDSRNRYSVLLRLHGAKKAETRLRRLESFVAMLDRHETFHPPAKKEGGHEGGLISAWLFRLLVLGPLRDKLAFVAFGQRDFFGFGEHLACQLKNALLFILQVVIDLVVQLFRRGQPGG